MLKLYTQKIGLITHLHHTLINQILPIIIFEQQLRSTLETQSSDISHITDNIYTQKIGLITHIHHTLINDYTIFEKQLSLTLESQ